ncbi:calcineurin-like phosphoesterase [Aureococcus anophagefferens]|nr:calcineurin-like phosphoesterase [Aureococcus anophagefferens]
MPPSWRSTLAAFALLAAAAGDDQVCVTDTDLILVVDRSVSITKYHWNYSILDTLYFFINTFAPSVESNVRLGIVVFPAFDGKETHDDLSGGAAVAANLTYDADSLRQLINATGDDNSYGAANSTLSWPCEGWHWTPTWQALWLAQQMFLDLDDIDTTGLVDHNVFILTDGAPTNVYNDDDYDYSHAEKKRKRMRPIHLTLSAATDLKDTMSDLGGGDLFGIGIGAKWSDFGTYCEPFCDEGGGGLFAGNYDDDGAFSGTVTLYDFDDSDLYCGATYEEYPYGCADGDLASKDLGCDKDCTIDYDAMISGHGGDQGGALRGDARGHADQQADAEPRGGAGPGADAEPGPRADAEPGRRADARADARARARAGPRADDARAVYRTSLHFSVDAWMHSVGDAGCTTSLTEGSVDLNNKRTLDAAYVAAALAVDGSSVRVNASCATWPADGVGVVDVVYYYDDGAAAAGVANDDAATAMYDAMFPDDDEPTWAYMSQDRQWSYLEASIDDYLDGVLDDALAGTGDLEEGGAGCGGDVVFNPSAAPTAAPVFSPRPTSSPSETAPPTATDLVVTIAITMTGQLVDTCDSDSITMLDGTVIDVDWIEENGFDINDEEHAVTSVCGGDDSRRRLGGRRLEDSRRRLGDRRLEESSASSCDNVTNATAMYFSQPTNHDDLTSFGYDYLDDDALRSYNTSVLYDMVVEELQTMIDDAFKDVILSNLAFLNISVDAAQEYYASASARAARGGGGRRLELRLRLGHHGLRPSVGGAVGAADDLRVRGPAVVARRGRALEGLRVGRSERGQPCGETTTDDAGETSLAACAASCGLCPTPAPTAAPSAPPSGRPTATATCRELPDAAASANNLGGVGPDDGDAEELGVAGLYELQGRTLGLAVAVASGSAYAPGDAAENGADGDALRVSVADGTDVALTFTLAYDDGTDVELPDGMTYEVTIRDLGADGDPPTRRARVCVDDDQYAAYAVDATADLDVTASAVSCDGARDVGSVTFSAAAAGAANVTLELARATFDFTLATDCDGCPTTDGRAFAVGLPQKLCDGVCEDDPDWHVDGKAEKGCAWVAENPASRCDEGKVGWDGASSDDACLEACGVCYTAPPTPTVVTPAPTPGPSAAPSAAPTESDWCNEPDHVWKSGEHTTLAYNNLGYHGPMYNDSLPVIRVTDVYEYGGVPLDFEVSVAEGNYTHGVVPDDVDDDELIVNGPQGETILINVMDGTQVTVNFRLFEDGDPSTTPHLDGNFYLTVFDLDTQWDPAKQRERLCVDDDQYAHYILTAGPDEIIDAADQDIELTLVTCDLCDQCVNKPEKLEGFFPIDQRNRSVMFQFTDNIMDFNLTLAVDCTDCTYDMGRFFNLGGYSNMCPTLPSAAPTVLPGNPSRSPVAAPTAEPTAPPTGPLDGEPVIRVDDLMDFDGRVADMLVTVAEGSSYQAGDSGENGASSGTVAVSVLDDTNVTLNFGLYYQDDGARVDAADLVDGFYLSVLDIDHQKTREKQDERVCVDDDQYSAYVAGDDIIVIKSDTSCVGDRGVGSTYFIAGNVGFACDNPEDVPYFTEITCDDCDQCAEKEDGSLENAAPTTAAPSAAPTETPVEYAVVIDYPIGSGSISSCGKSIELDDGTKINKKFFAESLGVDTDAVTAEANCDDGRRRRLLTANATNATAAPSPESCSDVVANISMLDNEVDALAGSRRRRLATTYANISTTIMEAVVSHYNGTAAVTEACGGVGVDVAVVYYPTPAPTSAAPSPGTPSPTREPYDDDEIRVASLGSFGSTCWLLVIALTVVFWPVIPLGAVRPRTPERPECLAKGGFCVPSFERCRASLGVRFAPLTPRCVAVLALGILDANFDAGFCCETYRGAVPFFVAAAAVHVVRMDAAPYVLCHGYDDPRLKGPRMPGESRWRLAVLAFVCWTHKLDATRLLRSDARRAHPDLDYTASMPSLDATTVLCQAIIKFCYVAKKGRLPAIVFCGLMCNVCVFAEYLSRCYFAAAEQECEEPKESWADLFQDEAKDVEVEEDEAYRDVDLNDATKFSVLQITQV